MDRSQSWCREGKRTIDGKNMLTIIKIQYTTIRYTTTNYNIDILQHPSVQHSTVQRNVRCFQVLDHSV